MAMSAPDSGVIWLCRLGHRAYEETWALQKLLVAARRRRAIPDLVLTVEHAHVITAGRGTHPENLRGLNAPDGSGPVPLFDVERGGDVTYHGPGQLVAYFLFDLGQAARDLHGFLRQVEGVQIELASGYGVQGERRAGKTGVWVGEKKIGSVGIAVRHWVTYHGFALNASTDLRFFRLINPCGFDAAVMSSLSVLTGREVTVAALDARLPQALGRVFERPVVQVGEKRLPRPSPTEASGPAGE
jgi:lipoyl(octanoyl) transferase